MICAKLNITVYRKEFYRDLYSVLLKDQNKKSGVTDIPFSFNFRIYLMPYEVPLCHGNHSA